MSSPDTEKPLFLVSAPELLRDEPLILASDIDSTGGGLNDGDSAIGDPRIFVEEEDALLHTADPTVQTAPDFTIILEDEDSSLQSTGTTIVATPETPAQPSPAAPLTVSTENQDSQSTTVTDAEKDSAATEEYIAINSEESLLGPPVQSDSDTDISGKEILDPSTGLIVTSSCRGTKDRVSEDAQLGTEFIMSGSPQPPGGNTGQITDSPPGCTPDSTTRSLGATSGNCAVEEISDHEITTRKQTASDHEEMPTLDQSQGSEKVPVGANNSHNMDDTMPDIDQYEYEGSIAPSDATTYTGIQYTSFAGPSNELAAAPPATGIFKSWLLHTFGGQNIVDVLPTLSQISGRSDQLRQEHDEFMEEEKEKKKKLLSPPEPAATNEPGQPRKVEDAISYVNEIKVTYKHHPKTFNQFLFLLRDFKQSKISIDNIMHHIETLFKDHPHLIKGFDQFLPANKRTMPKVKENVPKVEGDPVTPGDMFCMMFYGQKSSVLPLIQSRGPNIGFYGYPEVEESYATRTRSVWQEDENLNTTEVEEEYDSSGSEIIVKKRGRGRPPGLWKEGNIKKKKHFDDDNEDRDSSGGHGHGQGGFMASGGFARSVLNKYSKPKRGRGRPPKIRPLSSTESSSSSDTEIDEAFDSSQDNTTTDSMPASNATIDMDTEDVDVCIDTSDHSQTMVPNDGRSNNQVRTAVPFLVKGPRSDSQPRDQAAGPNNKNSNKMVAKKSGISDSSLRRKAYPIHSHDIEINTELLPGSEKLINNITKINIPSNGTVRFSKDKAFVWLKRLDTETIDKYCSGAIPLTADSKPSPNVHSESRQDLPCKTKNLIKESSVQEDSLAQGDSPAVINGIEPEIAVDLPAVENDIEPDIAVDLPAVENGIEPEIAVLCTKPGVPDVTKLDNKDTGVSAELDIEEVPAVVSKPSPPNSSIETATKKTRSFSDIFEQFLSQNKEMNGFPKLVAIREINTPTCQTNLNVKVPSDNDLSMCSLDAEKLDPTAKANPTKESSPIQSNVSTISPIQSNVSTIDKASKAALVNDKFIVKKNQREKVMKFMEKSNKERFIRTPSPLKPVVNTTKKYIVEKSKIEKVLLAVNGRVARKNKTQMAKEKSQRDKIMTAIKKAKKTLGVGFMKVKPRLKPPEKPPTDQEQVQVIDAKLQKPHEKLPTVNGCKPVLPENGIYVKVSPEKPNESKVLTSPPIPTLSPQTVAEPPRIINTEEDGSEFYGVPQLSKALNSHGSFRMRKVRGKKKKLRPVKGNVVICENIRTPLPYVERFDCTRPMANVLSLDQVLLEDFHLDIVDPKSSTMFGINCKDSKEHADDTEYECTGTVLRRSDLEVSDSYSEHSLSSDEYDMPPTLELMGPCQPQNSCDSMAHKKQSQKKNRKSWARVNESSEESLSEEQAENSDLDYAPNEKSDSSEDDDDDPHRRRRTLLSSMGQDSVYGSYNSKSGNGTHENGRSSGTAGDMQDQKDSAGNPNADSVTAVNIPNLKMVEKYSEHNTEICDSSEDLPSLEEIPVRHCRGNDTPLQNGDYHEHVSFEMPPLVEVQWMSPGNADRAGVKLAIRRSSTRENNETGGKTQGASHQVPEEEEINKIDNEQCRFVKEDNVITPTKPCSSPPKLAGHPTRSGRDEHMVQVSPATISNSDRSQSVCDENVYEASRLLQALSEASSFVSVTLQQARVLRERVIDPSHNANSWLDHSADTSTHVDEPVDRPGPTMEDASCHWRGVFNPPFESENHSDQDACKTEDELLILEQFSTEELKKSVDRGEGAVGAEELSTDQMPTHHLPSILCSVAGFNLPNSEAMTDSSQQARTLCLRCPFQCPDSDEIEGHMAHCYFDNNNTDKTLFHNDHLPPPTQTV